LLQKIRVKEKEVETVTICRKTMMRLLEHMHNKRLLNCIYKTLAMPDGSERKVGCCDAVKNIYADVKPSRCCSAVTKTNIPQRSLHEMA